MLQELLLEKQKENKFNCGADLVIIPAETLIISIIPTTGNIIKEAAINMEPADFYSHN